MRCAGCSPQRARRAVGCARASPQGRSVTNGAEGLLHGSHRVIRLVAGDAESPWPGALVCTPDGRDGGRRGRRDPRSRVGRVGCRSRRSPPRTARRRSGERTDTMCCSRCAPSASRTSCARRAGGAELSIGEAVTIAVSLLRGLAELPAATADVRGTWWLTDAGRPVRGAPGTGAASLEEQTAAHLRELAAEAPSLAAVLADAAAAMTEPRRRARELERAETAIFAVADPLALATTTFGPRRARDRAAIECPVEAEEPPPAHPPVDPLPWRVISTRTGRIWSPARRRVVWRVRAHASAGTATTVAPRRGTRRRRARRGPPVAHGRRGSCNGRGLHRVRLRSRRPPAASSDPAEEAATDESAAGEGEHGGSASAHRSPSTSR